MCKMRKRHFKIFLGGENGFKKPFRREGDGEEVLQTLLRRGRW